MGHADRAVSKPTASHMTAAELREVLRKYIIHVWNCEGVHFLESDLRRDQSEGYDVTPQFTDEEWRLLRDIADGLRGDEH